MFLRTDQKIKLRNYKQKLLYKRLYCDLCAHSLFTNIVFRIFGGSFPEVFFRKSVHKGCSYELARPDGLAHLGEMIFIPRS